jgi:PST family polysaccharide transporter
MSLPRLRHNIAALGALQIASYLIPLVTLPYLTRVLGVVAFGKVAFVLAVMAYFVLLTDYGFSWSATRQIAAHRNDHHFVSSVFSATWSAQWLLAFISGLTLIIAVTAIPQLKQDSSLYLTGFTLVIGNVFLPVWLLQGLERMREVAVIQVSGRLLALPPIFLLVKSPQDAIWAIALTGLGPFIAGLFTLYWIGKKRLILWQCPTWSQTFGALREGGPLFISKVSISLYTIITPLALGSISGITTLGYFSLADRIRSAAQALLAPISQALFPRMSHLFKYDPLSAHNLLKRSTLVIIALSGMTSSFIWGAADWIILLLGGKAFASAAATLRWLAFLPLIISLSNILGVQIMLPNGLNRQFNKILGTAAAFSLLIIIPLIFWKSAEGAAISTLLTEAFVTITMVVFVYKHGYHKPKTTFPIPFDQKQ